VLAVLSTLKIPTGSERLVTGFSPANWQYKVPESEDYAYIQNGGTAEIGNGTATTSLLYVRKHKSRQFWKYQSYWRYTYYGKWPLLSSETRLS